MNNLIDQSLSAIPTLKWLPWIGEHYFDLEENSRILIIGESHYHNGTEKSIISHNSPTFTRAIIQEMAIDRQYYKTKFFPNLHLALFRNDNFDKNAFWNSVSFFNFIQRPMNTPKSRPEWQEYYTGWETFFAIVKILKPTTCIFIGLTSSNSLADAIRNTELSIDGINSEDKIGGASPRTTTIKDKENNQIKLIFIRHTSQRFSWSKWNDYLRKIIPSELIWLEKRITS